MRGPLDRLPLMLMREYCTVRPSSAAMSSRSICTVTASPQVGRIAGPPLSGLQREVSDTPVVTRSVSRAHRTTPPIAAMVVSLAVVMTGCAVPQPGTGPVSASAPVSNRVGPPSGPSPVGTSKAHVTSGTSAAAWQGFGPDVNGAPALFTAHPDPAAWLLRMDPSRLRFRFIPGFKVPEAGPVRAVDRNPATWVPWMLAAFNGAFKLVDHPGGYFYDGRTVVRLRPGLASLVVALDGSMRVVVWSRARHHHRSARRAPEPQATRPRGALHDTRSDGPLTWGRPLHGLSHTNRSALAMLRDGSLVYVYVHEEHAQTSSRRQRSAPGP